MLRTNTKIVRDRIRQYLLDASFDYAAECLEKENPTDQEIMTFVVCDIKRVMGYRMVCGMMPQKAAEDYLRGLSLAVDFSYEDDFNRVQEWTESGKSFKEATESEICKTDNKYWSLLATEICRWFDEVKANS